MEALVREHLEPRAEEFVSPALGYVRSPGLDTPPTLIHSDFPHDHQQFIDTNKYITDDGIREWISKVKSGQLSEYTYINWWRPCDPMKMPIQRAPLCVCDPNSVVEDDVVYWDVLNAGVPEDMDVFRFMLLKYNPAHKWYFYPEMTKDEVLVFKQFQVRTEDGDNKRIPVFHGSFKDPQCPSDAE